MSYQVKDRGRYCRAQWMEKFESACVRLLPKLRGRVDWNAADYYYCQGMGPVEAAQAWTHPSDEKVTQ
jgi:hypothetical protein